VIAGNAVANESNTKAVRKPYLNDAGLILLDKSI
jgi:hypothetical protein